MAKELSHDDAFRAGVEVGRGTRNGPVGPLATDLTRHAAENGLTAVAA